MILSPRSSNLLSSAVNAQISVLVTYDLKSIKHYKYNFIAIIHCKECNMVQEGCTYTLCRDKSQWFFLEKSVCPKVKHFSQNGLKFINNIAVFSDYHMHISFG